MTIAQAVRTRDWSDSFTVGPIRVYVRVAGCVIGWRITGSFTFASPAERMETAFIFWRWVHLGRGSVWDVYDSLFPVLSGGTKRFISASGVAYGYYD